MSDSVRIVITADNGDAVRAFRDTQGQLRDMRGRFVSEGSIMSRSMNQLGKSIGGVKGALIPLATAAVPIMAKMAVTAGGVAAKTAGAGVALGAFGAALAGQVGSLKEAGEAQKKYTDAVAQNGRGSKQAAEAQRAVQTQLASMPQATARAAIALGTLKDVFQDFSDDTATFTMKPVERSFAVLGQVIPKLTPMVQGASTQLDRLVTIAGGAVASPGFDALSDRLATFANRSLKEAVDGIVHFSRALSEGQASGPITAFMEYAEKNGPAVQDTLANVGDALVTVAQGAAEAGPGMLTLVNAAAGLVASFPPELITTLLQTAVALKAVSLAGAAAAGIGGIMTAARTQIGALGATAAAAGGGLAGLRAAFLSLGTAAKASIVAGGILAVGLAVSKLSDLGQQAPPKMDQLTSSIRELGKTGKVTGEAARVFGTDMSELAASFDKVSDNGVVEFFDELSTGFGLFGEGTNEAAKKMIDDFDESLASLVKSGNADLAKASLENFRDIAAASGYDVGDLEKRLDGYKSSLADAKYEQEQAAEGMGFFGQAALKTSAQLEAQKMSADGLRASILALNDVNRSAHDAQTQFERSLDDLTESFKEHGATLNEDTRAGQANRDAMSAAAKAHDEMLVASVAAGDSMKSMQKDSAGLRAEMMELAEKAFKGNTKAATEYVNTLLGTPESITTTIKAEKDHAIAGLETVRAAIRATPDGKEVKVDTLNAAAIAALEAVGLKTKQLPDGKTAVYTANGTALGNIGSVATALNNLNGKTATTYVVTNYTQIRNKGYAGNSATGGRAYGGLVRGYADGGPLQHFPNGGYIEGPGGPRSDSILATFASGATAAVSDTEYVVQSPAVKKYGVPFMDALNAGRLKVAALADGGLTRLARGGVTKSEREARKGARGDLTISYFGQRAGFKNTEFANALGSPGSLGDLSSALNKWRSIIKKATHGGVENSLLKKLNSAGSALMKYEKQHDKLSKTLEKAKALRDDVSSGLKGEAGIVKSANASDSRVTINTLLSQMQGSAANTKQFSSMLTQLRKKGLSGDLVKQIATAGIDGGGMETAAAILGGGTAEIKQLNALQKQIGSAAKSAGNAAADAMYGAGMKAGEGLIAGLEKQQKAIEKQMMKIAKSMEKSIKKALGIKSPSQVMMQVGDYTAEGFAIGMRKNRSITPAWESMLNQPRTTMPAATGRAGGGRVQPIVVHNTITLDGRVVAQQIFDPLRKEVTIRGGLKGTFPRDFR